MSQGYWSTIRTRRLARRALLRSGAALSAGAAALSLLGCGGDSDSSESGSLLSKPEDSSSRAKAGGVLKTFTNTDTQGMDVIGGTNLTRSLIGAYTYPRLVKRKSVRYPDEPALEAEGDLAESVEISGDRLQL